MLKLPGIDADMSRLDAVIRKPWAVDGLTFSQRLWKDQTLVVNTLHQTLTRQVALSLPPDEAVKALVTAFPEKSMRSAIGRLVMTESNAIATAGNQEAYKATGVKQYEIVATLDSHTSAICQEMDGKRFPISKMEVGVTAPPFHPWCRTTTAPYDPDFESILPPEKRAARDAEGKTYLTEARTYKKWVNEKERSNSYRRLYSKNIAMPSEFIRTKGLSEDIKKEIVSAIEDLQRDYDIKIDKISYKDISVQGKIPFQFNPIKQGNQFISEFIINSGYDWNDTLEELNNRIYNKNYKRGKLESKNLSDLIAHEMAHFMTFQDCTTWLEFIEKEVVVRKKFVNGLSLYNSVARDGAETIAEGFVAIKNGKKVPTKVRELVQEYVERWAK
ncbi:MAG: minor capsid protein [Clostridia bacterium]|nr:minor capsid protein [Peptococcus niger]MDU7505381.1 minor capsid protein [Clostridia bacterium]